MINTGHVKTKGGFAGAATRKLTNTPGVIFSYTCRGKWFIFTKQIIIVLFESLCTATCRRSSKWVFLKIFTVHRETPEFLFKQLLATYFFNKRLRHRCFLVNFAKLSRAPFSQTVLGLLLLYLLNISVISQNFVLISQSGFSSLLTHS